MRLDAATLDALRPVAESHGLLRLGCVRLDDPGFEPARRRLEAYLDAGKQGEMEFLERTRALRARPEGMLEGAKSVLVALVPYRGEPGPIARYAQWADYHTEIHQRWLSFVPALEARFPGMRSLVCVDTKPLLERAAAVLAGLGSLGKNGCLIAPGLGSYVLIGALLIDLEFEGTRRTEVERETKPPSELGTVDGRSDAPSDAGDEARADASPFPDAFGVCGDCRRCLDACPTDAFDAPGDLDARACISYLTIERRGIVDPSVAEKIGERVAGCDVCQEVCPHNFSPTREARVPAQVWLSKPPGRRRDPDLVHLATLGNNQHRGFVKNTALNRIPRRALRRNAIIALGNRDAPLSAEEREALERASRDAEPSVAAAARWALDRRDAR